MHSLPYLLAFGSGLAGGFSHCIGMCGVFVIAATGMPAPGEPAGRFRPLKHVLFQLGRLAALSALGCAAGALGSITHVWLSAQSWASVVIGVLTLALALGFAGIVPGFRIPEPDMFAAGGGRLRRAFVRVLRSRHSLKPLAVGLFVGLLPCGLTYYWLVPSLAAGPLHGALLMALFCVGTMPGLFALGLAGSAIGARLTTAAAFRRRMTLLAAGMMAVLGIAFAWRGLSGLI
jgi:hypothetical protein